MASQVLRVLFVEDRADDADLVARELARAEVPCETRRIETAQAFQQALDDFRPDIVLADYKVTGFGGMAALVILKKKALAYPLIVVMLRMEVATAKVSIKAYTSR